MSWKLNPQGEGASWDDIPMPQVCEGCDCGCILDANGDGAVNGNDVEAVEQCVGGDTSVLRCCDINGDGSVNGNDVEEMELRVLGGC